MLQLLAHAGYETVNQKGSRRKLRADGRDMIMFSWKDGDKVPPHALRYLLVKKAQLNEIEIERILKGDRL